MDQPETATASSPAPAGKPDEGENPMDAPRMDPTVVDDLLRRQREAREAWEAICRGAHTFDGTVIRYQDGTVGRLCGRCGTQIVTAA